MKNIKAILVVLFMGTIGYADAQYYYGPPPPQQSRHREREQKEDEGGTAPTGFFEIGFGINNPVGIWGGSVGTGYGSYALPGDNINILICAPIKHSNFGISFMYSGANNFFDLGSYMNAVSESDQTRQYYYDPNTQDAYTESFILAGLFATLPVQRLSFDFRLMGGVAICGLPEVTYNAYATSSTAPDDYLWDVYHSNSASFASDIGADIRFKFRRISLMLGVDYMTTNPMVNTQEQYVDQSGSTTYTNISGSIPINIMCYSLGLGYQF